MEKVSTNNANKRAAFLVAIRYVPLCEMSESWRIVSVKRVLLMENLVKIG